mmetsp:Transcript_231/g.478  ORF Transcript_231/g.478 Transcript_231/m.478 type:complete len:95 (+) Transcript_231:579-863(+)
MYHSEQSQSPGPDCGYTRGEREMRRARNKKSVTEESYNRGWLSNDKGTYVSMLLVAAKSCYQQNAKNEKDELTSNFASEKALPGHEPRVLLFLL